MTHLQRVASLIRARLLAEIRSYRALYLVWFLWFIAFCVLVRSTLGGPDGTRYMSYIHSLVFDHDLVLMNELERFGQRVIVTSTGYSAQIANVGVILFWLPFYLLAVASAWLRGDVGSGMASNYQLWLDFGDWIYGLLALLVTYRWLRASFTRAVALGSTLLVSLGSSFVYYMTALAPSYHSIAALLCGLFLTLWDSTRRQRRPLQWFGLGVLAGLLMSIAQYHAVLLVFPALDTLPLIVRLFRAPAWLGVGVAVGEQPDARRWIAGATLALAGIVIPFVPQFIAWDIVYGNPFANPYTLEANWSGAHLLDVLFSSYHGLYFTAPLLALATLGWLVGFRADRALSMGALVAVLGIAFSSSTRIGWWAGVSFGMRYFIALTPLFALGFASLWSACASLPRVVRVALAAVATGCVLWTYGLFLQAFAGLTSFSEYHSAAQWIAGQLVVLGRPLDFLTVHWLIPRSTSLLSNLTLFALLSLGIVRAAGAWILTAHGSSSARWLAALALAPLVFAAALAATMPNGEAVIARLRATGYYDKNQARGEFDWEQFSNEYVERARYDAAIEQGDLARRDMTRAIALWPGSARRLVAPAETNMFRPLEVRFGDDLELAGIRVQPEMPFPGQPLTVTLLWRPDRRLPSDYDIAVILLDMRGPELTRTPPSHGVDPFPTSWWLPGASLSDVHVLDVSQLIPPTLLRVRVEVFDPQSKKRLAATANGVIGELKVPPALVPAGNPIATLGSEISLLEHTFTHRADGADLSLTWRAEAIPDKDYTVFVHLRDAQNRILAQSDAQPLGGRYPTHAWLPGEVITDFHRFTLDAATLARVEKIAIGLYTPGDGHRLPLADGSDAIILRPQPR